MSLTDDERGRIDGGDEREEIDAIDAIDDGMDATPDAGSLPDLTPARVDERPKKPFNRRLALSVGLIVIALGVLVFEGLGNATVYFKTADEAMAQRPKLGTKRFRIEGVVVDDATTTADGELLFHISNNGATVEIVHDGKAPGLFKKNIPVVLEGHFQAGSNVYASDRILVKHTEQYRTQNPDRVKDYDPPTTSAP